VIWLFLPYVAYAIAASKISTVPISTVVPFMSMGSLIGWGMGKLAQRVKDTLAFTLRSLRKK
jgi:hypothetical protein